MFEATPQPAEATAKIATPTTNIRRRPNRSPSEPPTRINAAKNRPYDSTTHCISATVAWKVAWIAGRATFTTVLSMKAMLEPRIVATSIQILPLAVHGTPAPAVRIATSSQGDLMKAMDDRESELGSQADQNADNRRVTREGLLRELSPPPVPTVSC